MGEIADMILDGTLDMYTGEYLGEPCGYPRSAQHHPTPQNRCNGIRNKLTSIGVGGRAARRKMLVEFGLTKGASRQASNEELGLLASEHYQEFVEFAKSNR